MRNLIDLFRDRTNVRIGCSVAALAILALIAIAIAIAINLQA